MSIVAGVVNPRHTNPLVQNVLLDASKSGLLIKATDLEVSLQYQLNDASVSKAGKVLLPAARLNGLLKDMSAETVELIADDESVVVSAERGKITLQTADVEGFPGFPEFKQDNALSIKASDFAKGLGWTGKSISPERGRYAFNGVLITTGKNGIEFCGTDGRRLSYMKVAGKAKTYDFPIIIPRRGIELFTRMAERAPDSDISLDIRENEVVARAGNAIASTALIDGQFPDYWTVIPRNNDKTYVARRADLISSLRLAGHVTSVESQSVAMEISKQEITFKTRSPGMGSAEVKLPVTYAGPDCRVGFDPRYLLDGLALMTADDVTCEFKDNETGVIFHEGSKDKAFFLVMPLDVG